MTLATPGNSCSVAIIFLRLKSASRVQNKVGPPAWFALRLDFSRVMKCSYSASQLSTCLAIMAPSYF